MTVVREPLGPPAHKPEDARRDVRRAWVSLALLPVAFALATLVGEGLLAVQGYGNAGVGTVSASAALWAGGPGLLVLMAPGAAALFFGLRARRHGRSAGLTPAAIGGVTILGSIALNVLAFLIGR